MCSIYLAFHFTWWNPMQVLVPAALKVLGVVDLPVLLWHRVLLQADGLAGISKGQVAPATVLEGSMSVL